jgi:hypothetical protein
MRLPQRGGRHRLRPSRTHLAIPGNGGRGRGGRRAAGRRFGDALVGKGSFYYVVAAAEEPVAFSIAVSGVASRPRSTTWRAAGCAPRCPTSRTPEDPRSPLTRGCSARWLPVHLQYAAAGLADHSRWMLLIAHADAVAWCDWYTPSKAVVRSRSVVPMMRAASRILSAGTPHTSASHPGAKRRWLGAARGRPIREDYRTSGFAQKDRTDP